MNHELDIASNAAVVALAVRLANPHMAVPAVVGDEQLGMQSVELKCWRQFNPIFCLCSTLTVAEVGGERFFLGVNRDWVGGGIHVPCVKQLA